MHQKWINNWVPPSSVLGLSHSGRSLPEKPENKTIECIIMISWWMVKCCEWNDALLPPARILLRSTVGLNGGSSTFPKHWTSHWKHNLVLLSTLLAGCCQPVFKYTNNSSVITSVIDEGEWHTPHSQVVLTLDILLWKHELSYSRLYRSLCFCSSHIVSSTMLQHQFKIVRW